MPQANVDPGELRRFARELKSFSAQMQTLISGLHGRMMVLEKSWRDQEQRRFAEEFEQMIKTLGRFIEISDGHVAFLNRKAELIEEYLRQR